MFGPCIFARPVGRPARAGGGGRYVPEFTAGGELRSVLSDESLTEMEQVSFNAGSHTVSVVMPGNDFRRALAACAADIAE